jgi:hypothetical protein
MSRFVALVGIDLRELWISFRLLPMLGVLLLSGLLPAVLSSVAPPPLTYSVALAMALALISAIAGFSLAAERRRGRAAWLTLRTVPRSALVLAWLASSAWLLLLGLLISALFAWLSLFGDLAAGELGLSFGVALVAVGAAGLATLSGSLLIGALLTPRLAATLSLLLSGGVLLAGVVPIGAPWLPSGGIGLLAQFSTIARPLASAAQSAGVALLVAALLLAAALVVLQRADL